MLVNKTNQLIEEVNEFKNSYMKMFGSEMFDHMDEKTFVLFKNLFNLLNTSMEMIKEQANVIENVDNKLDKLLERKES